MWKNKWTRGTKRKSVKENQKTAILQDKSWRDTSAFDRRQSCAFPTRDTDIRRQSWQSTGVPYISEMNDSENTPNRCRIRGLTHEQSSPFSWLTRPRYSSGRNSPAWALIYSTLHCRNPNHQSNYCNEKLQSVNDVNFWGDRRFSVKDVQITSMVLVWRESFDWNWSWSWENQLDTDITENDNKMDINSRSGISTISILERDACSDKLASHTVLFPPTDNSITGFPEHRNKSPLAHLKSSYSGGWSYEIRITHSMVATGLTYCGISTHGVSTPTLLGNPNYIGLNSVTPFIAVRFGRGLTEETVQSNTKTWFCDWTTFFLRLPRFGQPQMIGRKENWGAADYWQ